MTVIYDDQGVTLHESGYEDGLRGRDLEREGVKMVCTDPPYRTSESKVPVGSARTEAIAMPWGFTTDFLDVFAAVPYMAVCVNDASLGPIMTAMEAHWPRQYVFIWQKPNAPQSTRPVPRYDCEFVVVGLHPKAPMMRLKQFKSRVITMPAPHAGSGATERILAPGTWKALHGCQKPLALMALFIERMTEPGDLIMEPYAGTATTLVAAMRLNRRAEGWERDPVYAAAAANRLTIEGTARAARIAAGKAASMDEDAAALEVGGQASSAAPKRRSTWGWRPSAAPSAAAAAALEPAEVVELAVTTEEGRLAA